MSSVNEVAGLRSCLKAVLSLYSDGDLVQGDKVCWQETERSRSKVKKVILEGWGQINEKQVLPKKGKLPFYSLFVSIIIAFFCAGYIVFENFQVAKLSVDAAIAVMTGAIILVGLLICFAEVNGKVWGVILTVVNLILLALSVYQIRHEVCQPANGVTISPPGSTGT